MPAIVNVVSVAEVDPAWPIGTWTTTGNPRLTTVCNGKTATPDLSTSKVTVRAGAGLDYVVTPDATYPIRFCEWNGVPSVDNRAVLGGLTSCMYTTLLGEPESLTLDYVAMSLESEVKYRRARLFAAGSRHSTEDCTVTFDVELDRSFGASAVVGHHDETLPEPLVLKGWGEFDVADVGAPATGVATVRRPLIAEAVGPLPAGIVLDTGAYALSGDATASSFEVIVGLTNQGGAPACLASGRITEVTNSAGLPIVSLSNSEDVTTPRVGSLRCLRPGERGWIHSRRTTTDETAFGNAARARVSVSGEATATGRVLATPFRVRQSPKQGLEIDFVGAPALADVIFFDREGLPVGFSSNYAVFPEDAARPEVATVSLHLQPVYGQPTRIVVFARP